MERDARGFIGWEKRENKFFEETRITLDEGMKNISKSSKFGSNFKYLLFLGFFLFGAYVTNAVNNIEEVKKETFIQTKVQKYKNLVLTLKNIQKNDNEISMAVIIQNNGEKSVSIQHEYGASNTHVTDENGKRWKLTEVHAMEHEYSSPTQILGDGRRIVSEHIFRAVNEINGKDFYVNLRYKIDGKWVLLGFDHIEI